MRILDRTHARSAAWGLAAAALLALAPTPASAVWPQSLGGNGTDEVVVVKSSTAGDVYLAGHFFGSLQVNGATLTSNGLQDVFVARISVGGQVEWVRTAGGEGMDSVRDLVLDAGNAVHISGQFHESAFFGSNQLDSAGAGDGYLARLDADGAWRWARRMGGTGNDSANGVVALPGDVGVPGGVTESVLAVGSFQCQADFHEEFTLDGKCFDRSHDMFVARLEAGSGDLVWAYARPESQGLESAEHVTIDAQNRVYISGSITEGGLQSLHQTDFQESNGWFLTNTFAALFPSIGTAWAVFWYDWWFGITTPHEIGYTYNLGFGSGNVLALRAGFAQAISPEVDTSDATSLQLDAHILRGFDHGYPGGTFGHRMDVEGGYSELPESDEPLIVTFRGKDDVWYEWTRFPGGVNAGEHIDRTGAAGIPLTHPMAFHDEFQVRFLLPRGAGSRYDHFGHIRFFDWWYVDDVKLQMIGAPTPFVMSINNVLTDEPAFSQVATLPDGVDVTDLAVNGDGTRLLVHGNWSGGNAWLACAFASSVPGAYVASLDTTDDYSCDWTKAAAGGEAGGIAVDALDNVYITGAFSGATTFSEDPGGTLVAAGERDVFIASIASDGTWRWVTGGDTHAADAIPSHAGGTGDDAGHDVAVSSSGTVYVGGHFSGTALLGPVESLVAAGETDAFVVNLGANGRFFEEEKWVVGVPLTPPSDAKLDNIAFVPDFKIAGQPFDALEEKIFVWAPPVAANGNQAQLIPLQPFGSVEVHWRVDDELESTARTISIGGVRWPSEACGDAEASGCFQVHVAGAPVEAEPASGDHKVRDLVPPSSGSSGATYSGGRFTATRGGTATLVYVQGPTLDETQYPIVVEVVRTLASTAVPMFVDNVPAEIGKPIFDPFHTEPGRTGFVVNELAYYDGAGSEPAYNRSSRTGVIVPVNRYSTARPQDEGRELVVAWYHRKHRGVYWPEKVVRYEPHWPYDPERLIIASEQGGEVLGQEPLSSTEYPSARIYIQNDFNQPGYNPNDEHALIAPSQTGTGAQAVFALRSDFGDGLPGDKAAASDPYTLVKYFDPVSLQWTFRVYRVMATGSGFEQFRYSGTAGTTVSPPYPVRLLPACGESFVEGQAVGQQPPPPFFQDYKGQIWAKSAGSGAVMYYYPAQAGYFTDLDNDDVNDVETGTCLPWLARLPASEGGSALPQDPIRVAYDISWPDESPLLVSGETLLTPKRGLPDILNQAAVEVVYDDIQANTPDALPADTLAQLMDPLNPRTVRLDLIPEAIATQFQTDGTDAILGSADGTIKLPVSIRDRLRYNGQNNALILTGIFDETGAGEPFLLLNVLSKRDRVALKKLDGGDGQEESDYSDGCDTLEADCNWDQAVEALFRLSRNPQRINLICRESFLHPESRERICTAADAVTEDDVLVGYQDQNDDGILEPFQASGVSAALSAGLSQGSGYVTLAFNNDPALTPLPVSLEIIQVGCLVSPPPPETATLVSSYQGQINVISPDNIFDEQLVLRHSGDFGGNPDVLEFEWFFHPDTDGSPPMPLPDPATGQLNGWIQFPTPNSQGAVEISIEGANIQTLSDNWYLARYRGLPGCGNSTNWSLWAGQPGATPLNQRAQLAPGWVKRVLARLNPFEARVQNFAEAATNTYAGMLVQLGERYSGPIALNNDPDNLNSIGLIEAYTTVLRRAMQLSVDSTPPVNYDPANTAILLVASRLVDFYTLLGNEAFADAQDPTIGITTNTGSFAINPSIFNFQNQLDSLLSEELVLLRGRDESHGPVAASPVYNRLFWNFTTGDGEVAYALSYNITDQDENGVLNEFDARVLFPQGHGDAWGHYLTGTKIYYDLLRHPFYSWNPRPEAVPVAGVPINVDFLDERQFAETAADKARTGSQIVDLTYRYSFVEDPAGQWQGYEDTDPQRAWGLAEWGRRAGMGAYFDWVTVNAILPDQDPDPSHVGIQRIDRTTVGELDEIAAAYLSVQSQVDEADAGLNPLGLAQGVVKFDIDPTQLDRFNTTQFEQVYSRAMGALSNALQVWEFANQLNNQLRRTQDNADNMFVDVREEETGFENELIEIFGYPYEDDIGGSGTYPAGYNGPDMYHYMLVDVPELAGTSFDFDSGLDLGVSRIGQFTGTYAPVANGVNFFDMAPAPADATHTGDSGQNCASDPISSGCALGGVDLTNKLEVTYTTIESPDFGFWFTKPADWTGQRRAPGRLQEILHEMLQARIALKQALVDYDRLRLEIEAQVGTLQATFDTSEANINLAIGQRNELKGLTTAVAVMSAASIAARRVGEFVSFNFKTASSCIPRNAVAGVAAGGDLFSAGRCAVEGAGSVPKLVLDTVADGLDIASNSVEAAKEDVSELSGIRTSINDAGLEIYNVKGELDKLMREEPVLRGEIYARTEAIKQLVGSYQATLAEGMRLFDRLVVFRKEGAAAVQQFRYEDMAFRVFRNDALQKYRAAYDLAARYVYLAAAAYDYETNLLGSDSQAGRAFLTDIVRERSLGQIINGVPVSGSPGLADTMAQMKLNFDVLKGQMGFNNPQVETNRFSLRRELFRIPDGPEGDAAWRQKLAELRVDDLWMVPEFRRYARPFAPESAGPQPGLVIEFSTNVTFGLNFFGWELGPQDSSYDSSQFATRIRSVGAWFGDYNTLPLADDPRIYLFPVGADVLRAPSANDFTTREWQIVDQAVPIPFPIGSQDLDEYGWLPLADTLNGSSTDLRRYGRFRAYHLSEPFDDSQVTSDSRLIGRSVWNRRWMIIIPGGTFLNDPVEGLETFIHGTRIPGSAQRDGVGVSDIRIFFKTYAYSGL